MKGIVKERKTHNRHLSADEIRHYLDLSMSNREMYLVERHLLDCNLCQEALEGYERHEAKFIRQQVQDLKGNLMARIEGEQATSKRIPYLRYGIAATILALLVSIFFVWDVQDFAGKEVAQAGEDTREEYSPAETMSDSTAGMEQPLIALGAEEEAEEPPQSTSVQAETTPPASTVQETPQQVVSENRPERSLAQANQPEAITESDQGAGGGAVADLAVTTLEVETMDDLEEEPAVDEVETSAFGLAANEEVTLVEPTEALGEAIQDLPSDEERQKRFSAKTEAVAESPAVRSRVEEDRVEPRPINGFDAYLSGLLERLEYPQEAAANSIEGEVTVTLVIGTNGAPENLQVSQSLGFGCDEEAIRLIREGPNWLPATRDAQPIAAPSEIVIPFKLSP